MGLRSAATYQRKYNRFPQSSQVKRSFTTQVHPDSAVGILVGAEKSSRKKGKGFATLAKEKQVQSTTC